MGLLCACLPELCEDEGGDRWQAAPTGKAEAGHDAPQGVRLSPQNSRRGCRSARIHLPPTGPLSTISFTRCSADDPCVPGPEGQERRDAKKTPLPGLKGSWDAPELTAPSSERLFPRGRVRRCLCTVLRSAVSGPSSLCELIQRKTSGVKRSGSESEIGSSAHRVSVNQTRPLVLVKRDWDSIEQMVFFFFSLKAPHS